MLRPAIAPGQGGAPGALQAAQDLLSVVYAELRQRAAAQFGQLPPGQE